MGMGMFYTYIPRFLRAFGIWLVERKSFFTSFLLSFIRIFSLGVRDFGVSLGEKLGDCATCVNP